MLVATAAEATRNGDVLQEFRPGSDFHFLTGFPEPGAILAAWRTGARSHRAVLFVRPRDKAREVWDGPRFGVVGARKLFGFDEAYSLAELWQRLPSLAAAQPRLFHRLGVDVAFDRRLLDAFAALGKQHRKRQQPLHPAISDPIPTLAAIRLQKDAAELAALGRAAAISVAGHLDAMRVAKPGLREYEVQAALESRFRREGSPRNGYPSIVASGRNACVLHYHENDRELRAGDLLLIDAGAEFAGCTADITRTFPVSGRFTEAQAAVYQIVLRAQVAGIRACRVGAPWDRAHKVCVRVLTRGLVKLGVLRGKVAKLVKKEKYKPFYMHGTSHWLGRDVHDVGAYQDHEDTAHGLVAGAVLTVEPGLYFAPTDRRVPKQFRGIGIRIEDDVLITRKGPVVLTNGLPKGIREIERACGGESKTR